MRLPHWRVHPRAWIDAALTYPRFIGTIKPSLIGAAAVDLAPRMAAYRQGWWPKRLEAPVAENILALSPHPDDEAIGCGGLLLAHAGRAKITIVNVYNGDGDGGGALAEGPWRNEAGYRSRLAPARASELDEVGAALQVSAVVRFGVSDCDGAPGPNEIKLLRDILRDTAPEIVLIPWFLDDNPHHKSANRLFAEAADGLNTMVLGYEIWSLLTPNAYFDISALCEGKRRLIAHYVGQLHTVDYISYADGLGRARAFHLPVADNRSGAEAFLALPSRDYCDLVRAANG